MPIDLYYYNGSGPCRSVILAAKAIGVELNLIFVDLDKGDHLKPEFLKLNPQHVVPTLNDNGFILWESRAICIYLAEKYAKDDSLFPKDAQKRAVVIQRLFFDAGTLYQNFSNAYYPLIMEGIPYTDDQVKKIHDGFELLNTFLDKTEYVAGDNITLADYTLYTSVTSIEVVDFDISRHTNVTKWLNKLKSIFPAESDEIGAPAMRKWYLDGISANKK